MDSGLAPGLGIAGFTAGDTLIDLDLPFDPFASFSQSGDTITISAGGETAEVDLVDTAGASFVLDTSTAGGGLHTALVETIACFGRGTLIATPDGEVAVEDLRIGQSVCTASGGHRPVRWIGTRAYDNRFLRDAASVMPIRFAPGALGGGLPRRALLLSPEHAVLLDGALVPAKLLENGGSIAQLAGLPLIEYFHVELDRHDVLLAEGAAAESFIDDASRNMFANAPEYHLLYPGAARVEARFCAPRLEHGDALAAIQRRLAAAEVPAPAPLSGYLDTADAGTLTGWAREGEAPVVLRILIDGVVMGTTLAGGFRPDLAAQGIGDGHHGFTFAIPGGLSGPRHRIEVQRASDGAPLDRSPLVLQLEPPMALVAAAAGAMLLAGALDVATRDRLSGWAWHSGSDAPVALQLLDNGRLLTRVLANMDRPDLRAAGIGCGRHAFDVAIPGGLSPLSRHVLEVRRETDGAALPGTPVVIEPASSFDHALQETVARAVAAQAGEDDDRVLSFLLAQTDRLLERRAATEAGMEPRRALAQFRRRWGSAASLGEARGEVTGPAPRRALVIDVRLPEPGRDAGSEAVLSHMRALQRLGYAVSMVAADDLQTAAPALAAAGIAALGRPTYGSVEDLLRRQAGGFDLVYLHRVPVAARYLDLVRTFMPRARVVFAVADLHHLRLQRQAQVQGRADLARAAAALRLAECTAAWSSDCVITHSAPEAERLRTLIPGANVRVVPWVVPVGPGTKRPSFGRRSGIAFIGHGAHAPNVDAARWLIEAIMPLVWQEDEAIECFLVGSDLPPAITRLEAPRVTVLGHVPDLQSVFDRVRLSVAPLRFGAGVKGKVLTSLAARTPCIMTPVAAEGFALPSALLPLVGGTSNMLASLILRYHGDAGLCRAASRAGSGLLRSHTEDAVVDALALATADEPGKATRQSA